MRRDTRPTMANNCDSSFLSCEKDINTIVEVDSNEAEKLLKLIELLIDKWYIARHDEEELFNEITQIADDKSTQKSSNSQSSNVS